MAPRNSTIEAITQRVYKVAKENKIALLSTLLRTSPEQTLVFSRTKHGANNLVKKLHKDGVTAIAIHGNKSQAQRTKALKDFKDNKVQVMVATDIAARGIDIDDLAQVINFDMPHVPEDYVHRIGRTGRAGAAGLAMSLVSPDENSQLRNIERLIKQKIELAELPEFTQSTTAPVRSEQTADKNKNTQGNRRRTAKKPDNKSGQAKQRHAASGQAANDANKEDQPKRRRRPRVRNNKNRNKQAAGQGQDTGNKQTTATTAASSPSAATRIKRFFSSKKVA